MKNLIRNPKRTMLAFFMASLFMIVFTKMCFGQGSGPSSNGSKASIAVMGISTKGITADATTIRKMVQFEIEKTNQFSVMDEYDIQDRLVKVGITLDDCFGKSCLVEVGKALNVNKIVAGGVERFGEKIVITLRLINVDGDEIEKVEGTEYLNLQEEIQKMVRLSVNNLFDLPNDQNLVNLLVDYDAPIASPKTTLKLNGPRMGISFTLGDAAERLQASKSDGGYEMFPVMTQFGYQWETQYLSAGSFQALLEAIGLIGGLESGKFIPSISLLNGFRSSTNGWEFAFGPSFKLVKTAAGYYDEQGNWNLEYEWDPAQGENPNDIQELPDNRGSVKLSTNLVLAIGKTFKSGYLNIPVNVYVVPNKKGTIIGTSVGFNINKRKTK